MLGNDFRISTTGTETVTTQAALDPSVAYGPTPNDYLVAWEADGGATDGEFEISGQRVSAAGAEQGGDFQISNVEPPGALRDGLRAAVAYSTTSVEFLVAWHGNPNTTLDDHLEIWAQRVSTAGGDMGGDFQISNSLAAGSGRNATNAALAYNPSADQYLATWRDDRIASGEFDVFGHRLAVAPPAPAANPVTVKKKCKKGFKLKKVKGKKRCVKKKRKKR